MPSYLSWCALLTGAWLLAAAACVQLLVDGTASRLGLFRFLARAHDNALTRMAGLPDGVLVGMVPSTIGDEERARAFHPSTGLGDLTGTVSLVTGGNIGIGYYSALALAQKGSTVVLGCRSVAKCEAAAAAMNAELGNSSSSPAPLVTAMQIDTSDFASVDAFVARFVAAHSRLDRLLLNAGVAAAPRALSTAGLELIFHTNHIGHFQLYLGLRALIEATASQFGSATIVSTSSAASFTTYAHGVSTSLAELNDAHSYAAYHSYGQSKLAQVLFTQELARRMAAEGKDVFVNCYHPGFVATNLMADRLDRLRRSTLPAFVIDALLYVQHRLRDEFMWSAQDGALTGIYLAASADIVARRISGQYYHPIAVPIAPHPAFATPELGARLWDFSTALVARGA